MWYVNTCQIISIYTICTLSNTTWSYTICTFRKCTCTICSYIKSAYIICTYSTRIYETRCQERSIQQSSIFTNHRTGNNRNGLVNLSSFHVPIFWVDRRHFILRGITARVFHLNKHGTRKMLFFGGEVLLVWPGVVVNRTGVKWHDPDDFF